MSTQSIVFRKHHRLLSIIVFLPLALLALTGTVSPILDAFHLEQATVFVRRIHSGKIFFGSAYSIYAVPSGLGLLGLLVTGLNLLKRLNRSRKMRPMLDRLEQAIEQAREPQVLPTGRTDEVILMLSLLLPNAERAHLLNLARNHTQAYRGNRSLCAELQHLQALGLICPKPERSLDDLSGEIMFDLANYVELTDLGSDLIQRLLENALNRGDLT